MKKLIVIALTILISQNGFSQKLVFFNSKKLPETINSDLAEMLPILSADGNTLFFVRDGLFGGKGLEDIWYSTKDAQGNWSEANNNLKNLNNKEGNFIIGISRENNRLYLRNAYDKKMKNLISIAGSNFENGEWQDPYNIQALPDFGFRGKSYNMYITHNEKYLFISMNIPGTNGKEDLYLLTKNDDNTWSKPVHLGDNINTKEVEMSPFITEDGKYLFFASNGLGGFGDFDIFFSERLDDTYQNWAKPINLGKNINSAGFDAYFHVSHNNEVFYSSTRGEAQYEDIYTSEMHLFEKKKRRVIIHDLNNIEVVTENANGTIDQKFKFVNIESMKDYLIVHKNDTVLTGDLAEFEYDIVFELDSNSDLEEKLNRLKDIGGYESIEDLLVDKHILEGGHVDFANLDSAITLLDNIEQATSDSVQDQTAMAKVAEPEVTTSEPEKVTEVVTVKFETGQLLRLVNHDFDVATHQNGSGINIDDVVKTMKENPYLIVSIESHTDSKGSDAYNMELAKRRSNSAKTYLLRQGISANRIKATSFGETKPLADNTNKDGSDNPDGRAKNRRTEFRVKSNTKL